MRSLCLLILVVVAALAVAAVSTDDSPLVSIVIPTHGRSEFLHKALDLIQRQGRLKGFSTPKKWLFPKDYPHLEVVIVDDSDKPEGNIPLEMNGIPVKYLYLGSRVSIGEKRNIAGKILSSPLITR